MSNKSALSVKSSWTPLSREETNHKIFDERRMLIRNWFDKWTDEQRKLVISDLVSKCKNKQLIYAGEIIQQKKPIYKGDFTSIVPRVVSLYIFSFLDPRSLCRCAQVSWHWKSITELDQLWMRKCLRLGWVLTFSPSPYEQGVWKRLYIENIMALKVMAPRKSTDVRLTDIEHMSLGPDSTRKSTSRSLRSANGGKSKLPPWRGTDPNPKDMWRNNVLENDDDKQKVDKLRKKHIYGPLAEDILKKAKTKVRTGEHAAMIKAIHTEQKQATGRPGWAAQSTGGYPMDQSDLLFDASLRPAPVAAPVKPVKKAGPPRPQPDYTEIHGSPWQRPIQDGDSDT